MSLQARKHRVRALILSAVMVLGGSVNAAEQNSSHREAAKKLSIEASCLHTLKCTLRTKLSDEAEWRMVSVDNQGTMIMSALNQNMTDGFLLKQELPYDKSPHVNFDLLCSDFEDKLMFLYDEAFLNKMIDIFERNKMGGLEQEELQLIGQVSQEFTKFIDEAVILNLVDWRYTTFQNDYAERVEQATQLLVAYSEKSNINDMVHIKIVGDDYYTSMFSYNFKIKTLEDMGQAIPQFNAEKFRGEMLEYFIEQSLDDLKSYNEAFSAADSSEEHEAVRKRFNRLVSDFINYRVFGLLKAGGQYYLQWYMLAGY